MRNGKSKRNNEKGKREEKEKKKNRSTPPKYNVTDTRGKRERERGSFGWEQTVEAGEGDDPTKADHVGGTRTVLSVPRRWEYVQE